MQGLLFRKVTLKIFGSPEQLTIDLVSKQEIVLRRRDLYILPLSHAVCSILRSVLFLASLLTLPITVCLSYNPCCRPTSWHDLPEELRIMILKGLVVPKLWRTEKGRRHTNQSVYATVCREWQELFERTNFRTLVLCQTDLSELRDIVIGHRRKLVNWIWLRVELQDYDCNRCSIQETSEEIQVNNSIFTNAIWTLFSLLSSWSGERLTLELSAHSPSDLRHWFKALNSRENDTTWSGSRTLQSQPNDPIHGWEDGQQVRQAGEDAITRVFGPPLGGDSIDV